MDRKEVLIGLAGMAVSIAAVGRAQAQTAAAYPADYATIVEGSKAEGPMTVYSVFGEEFWPTILEPLNAKYPWLKVNYLDLGGTEAVQRYLIEKSAGSKTADFLVLNSPQAWSDLAARGEVVEYKSPESSKLPDWAIRHPGVYGILIDAEVFAWNKRLLPAELAPSSMEDFAAKVSANKDVFDGKVVAFPAMQDAYRKLALLRLLEKHGEKMWTWLDAIGPSVRFESSSGTMVEKILSGEFVVGMGVPLARCVTTMQDPARAALFDWAYMKDGTTVGPRQAGIPVGGATPNSSRLLLDVILSQAGQTAVAKTNKIPIRSDLATADLPEGAITVQQIIDAIGAENVVDVYYKPEQEAGNAAFIAKYTKAFNVKS